VSGRPVLSHSRDAGFSSSGNTSCETTGQSHSPMDHCAGWSVRGCPPEELELDVVGVTEGEHGVVGVLGILYT
jgi:hypothetical protein